MLDVSHEFLGFVFGGLLGLVGGAVFLAGEEVGQLVEDGARGAAAEGINLPAAVFAGDVAVLGAVPGDGHGWRLFR